MLLMPPISLNKATIMIAILGTAMTTQLQAIILLTSALKASVPLGLTTIQRARTKLSTALRRKDAANSQVQNARSFSNSSSESCSFSAACTLPTLMISGL